jgi:hypothetical protein
MDDKLIIQKDRKPKKGAPMLNHDPDLDTLVAAKTPQFTVPPPRAARPEGRLDPGRFLTPLGPAIASWHRCPHQGGSQVIIRFKNGYGAIISEYRRLAGIYEVLPLRFPGPGPDDYEFHFRSHVPDLNWCSGCEEIVGVCDQISRLLPSGRV